jgi:hypothetical protein
MNKDKNTNRAIEIFGAHSSKNTLYFSSDGQAFFAEADCRNHAKTLKDKQTTSINREDVMPSEVSESDEDTVENGKEELTPAQIEAQKRLDRQNLEALYAEVLGKEVKNRNH